MTTHFHQRAERHGAQLFVLLLASLVGWAHPVSGWAQPYGQPAVLMSLVGSETLQGEAQVQLNFASPAPKFAVIRNDSDSPAIAFAQTARGSGASFAPSQNGLIRSISFDQSHALLTLTFSTASPSRITASRAGDRAILLTLTNLTAPRVAASVQPGPLQPVPREQDRDPSEDGFAVVLLKYADVSEVVGLLADGQTVKSNDAFVPQEPAFGSAGIAGGPQSGPPMPVGGGSDREALGESVDDSIAIDRRLNAIILKGSPDRIARLKAKIAAIDMPVQSVLLETMFVELDESGARNVGLDFNNANSQVAVATFQSGGFLPTGELSGRSLTSVSLQAAVLAEVRSGHGRIVSKPRIAAQSGSTAKIITGDALPILTSIALSGVNAVSQQVQYVNVGVTLQIAPRVSDDGFVTSHVFCVVSSVTGTSQGYPRISQREAETSATVRDGETFVIGGLTQESDIVANSDLPGIGKVPVLGDLLGVRTATKSKTELYIVVTPHIIRGAIPAQ
ncbi:MAG: type II secretion system protein GspD [Mycobacteriales bacterium]